MLERLVAAPRPIGYIAGHVAPAVARSLAVLLAAACGVGCGTQKLDTGYAYTPLGDSPTKRRGYYADPFSPEARRAQSEQRNAGPEMDARRNVPGQ